MGENLSKVVRNGFDTYRHNPKISIPFLLYLLLILSLLISMMIPLHYGGMNPEELFPLWFLIFLLAISIGPFFLAGTVGMAKEATLEGKTSLGTMWMEGKKHYFGILLAAIALIVIVIIVIATLSAFMIVTPLFTGIDIVRSFINFLLILILMLVFLLFVLTLGYIVPVSIVVEDIGAAEGIEKGLGFVRPNKLDVLLITLLYLVGSIIIELAVVGMIFGATTIFGLEDLIFSESEEYSSLLSVPVNFIELVVLYPLFIVLWTRLYMVRTGRLRVGDAETPLPKIPTDKSEDQQAGPEKY